MEDVRIRIIADSDTKTAKIDLSELLKVTDDLVKATDNLRQSTERNSASAKKEAQEQIGIINSLKTTISALIKLRDESENTDDIQRYNREIKFQEEYLKKLVSTQNEVSNAKNKEVGIINNLSAKLVELKKLRDESCYFNPSNICQQTASLPSDKVIDVCSGVARLNQTAQLTTYKNFCCNGSDDPSNCTDDYVQCSLDQNKFMTTESSITNFDVSVLNTKQDFINGYCDMGENIMSRGCNLYPPMKSSTFTSFCCNGSTDPVNCSTGARQCVFNAGVFAKQDLTMGSISLQGNESLVISYCTLGKNLLDNKCKTVDPMQSASFTRLCCGGSNYSENCGPAAVQCTLDTTNFTTLNGNAAGTSYINYVGNEYLVGSYCSAGTTLISNKCPTDPTNYSNFRNLCCKATSDPTQCSTDNTCVLAANTYAKINKNIGYYSMNPSLIPLVNNYCNSGYTLTANGCENLLNPRSSSSYIKMCCGSDSMNPSSCNATNRDAYTKTIT